LAAISGFEEVDVQLARVVLVTSTPLVAIAKIRSTRSSTRRPNRSNKKSSRRRSVLSLPFEHRDWKSSVELETRIDFCVRQSTVAVTVPFGDQKGTQCG